MPSREFMGHRQAYFPRRWPQLLVAMVLSLPLTFLLADTWWEGAIIGALVATVVFNVVIFRWRRKHRELTVDELLERRRETARWN